MIAIKINDQQLDLNQNETLAFQIESNIMKNMKDYKASYSYSYQIPLTQHNIRVLGIENIMHEANPMMRKPIKYNNVEYIDGGVVVFYGDMYVEQINLGDNTVTANFIMSKNEAISYWKTYDIKPSQIMNRVDVWEDNFRVKGDAFEYNTAAMQDRYFASYDGYTSLAMDDTNCDYYKVYAPVPDALDCFGRGDGRADFRKSYAACPWLMNDTWNELNSSRSVTGTVDPVFSDWCLSIYGITQMIQQRDNVKFVLTESNLARLTETYYLTARLAKRDYAHFLADFNHFKDPDQGLNSQVGLYPLTTCSIRNEKLWPQAFNHFAYNYHSESGENLPSYYTAKNKGGYVYRQPTAFYQNTFNLMSIRIKSNCRYKSNTSRRMAIYLANDWHETASGGGNWTSNASSADITSDIFTKVYEFPSGFNGAFDVTIQMKDTTLPESYYRGINFFPQVRIFPCVQSDDVRVEGTVDYEFYFDGEDSRLSIQQMYYQKADYYKTIIPTDGGKAGSVGHAYYNRFDCLPNNINITEWLSNIMFDTCGAFAVTKNMQESNTIYWLSLDDIYMREMQDWTERMLEGEETAYNNLKETGTEMDRFKHSYLVHNNDWLSTILNVWNTELVKRVDTDDDTLDFSGTTYESRFEYHWPHLLYAHRSAGAFNVLNDRLITWNKSEVTYGRSGAQIEYRRGEPSNMPYHSQDGCYFLNHIEEYPVFLNVIKHPVTLKGRFAFDAVQLKNLDMTRPVYLHQFGSKFAVISLQTEKLNDELYDVKATLLKLEK